MQGQNPYLMGGRSSGMTRRPIVLSRKQLSVDARTGKPRVTRPDPVEPAPSVDGNGPRARARRLRQMLRDGQGNESTMGEALRAHSAYANRKARG